jgi:multidrug resistance efflux pump
MSEVKPSSAPAASPPRKVSGGGIAPHLRVVPFLITLLTVAVAAYFGWMLWSSYMATPWTRDGRVRVYVVDIAPEVSGRIVQLPVVDNQLVHKGDLLMVIDPTNYAIAVRLAQAAATQANATAQNKQIQAQRREHLSDLATSVEEKEDYASSALAATAAYQQAEAALSQAQVNLERTQIKSPVNGYVTNLLVQLGDYANAGQNKLALVDADSYWVDGYFEETALWSIREGDPARVRLMGAQSIIEGHVASIARGIDVPDVQADASGLATVNPIFTWVRLAQRVPVRIALDKVPAGIRLVAGQTATVQIDRPAR